MDDQLKKWAAERNLSLSQIFDYCLLTSVSYGKIRKGEKRFPPMMHRLYRLTELEVFKLSEQELAKLLKDIESDPNKFLDEQIFQIFLKKFSDGKELDSQERFSLRGNTTAIVRDYCRVVYFEQGDKSRIALAMNIIFDEYSKLLQTMNKKEILEFKKEHREELMQLFGICKVLESEDPKAALKLLNTARRMLK